MSQHINRFSRAPKRAYDTRVDAQIAADRQMETTVEYYEPYRCYKCKQWHIGRKGMSVKMKYEIRRMNNAYDEVLVGKLIPLLRGMIER